MADTVVRLDAAAVDSSLQSCQALFFTLQAIPTQPPASLTTQFQATISLLQLLKNVPNDLNVPPTINSHLERLHSYCAQSKMTIDEAAQSRTLEWTTYSPDHFPTILKELKYYTGILVVGIVSKLQSQGYIILARQAAEEFLEIIAEAKSIAELKLAQIKEKLEATAPKPQPSQIWRATSTGHEDIVQQLLDAGIVDAKDSEYGHTSLSWAAMSGHEDIVKKLLDTGEVDVNAKDSEHGHTPLSWAATFGHEAVVKLLLNTGEVDVNAKDSDHGQTPLFWAAMFGNEAVVKLLLDTGKVDVDTRDSKHGHTPLFWAARNGHEAVVKLLLDTGKVDVNVRDSEGQTPLSWAVRNGHKAVVKLLDTGKVDVNAIGL